MFISLHEGGILPRTNPETRFVYEEFNDLQLLILPVDNISHIVGRKLKGLNDPFSVVTLKSGDKFFVVEDAVTIAKRIARVYREKMPDLEV